MTSAYYSENTTFERFPTEETEVEIKRRGVSRCSRCDQRNDKELVQVERGLRSKLCMTRKTDLTKSGIVSSPYSPVREWTS